MKLHSSLALTLACSLALAAAASAQTKGPSTGSTPYVLPTTPGYETISVLTVDNTGANPDDTVPKVGGGSYGLDGVPDGLGAFDNGDGTFTLVMNHEFSGTTNGDVHAHGSRGSYVSRFVINKNTFAVLAGEDLMKQIFPWDAVNQVSSPTPATFAFARFCSGDLAAPTAYFNAATGLGSTARIYLHGEEASPTGFRQQATVVTGPSAGNSYTLGKFNLSTNGSATSVLSPVQLVVTVASTGSPSVTYSGTAPTQLVAGALLLGQTVTAINTTTKVVTLSGNANANISSATGTDFTVAGVGSWENALANPFAQDKTVVIGNNDGGTGIMNNALSVYVGTKQASGSEADKAGLTNGTLKHVRVGAIAAEIANTASRTTNITSGTRFSLDATSSTTFSRPEDGAWNPANPNEYYFVTTDQLDQVSDGIATQIGQTRLWRLTFDDITNPDLGGKIDLLIDGRTVSGEKVNMFDNLCVNEKTGHLLIQEDVGNAAHNGKVWEYDPATDTLTKILKHDVARFGDVVSGVTTAATAPFNQDEETSGIIDISSIMATSALNRGYTGEAWYISSDQAHYTSGITASQVEGGQLFVVHDTRTAGDVSVTRGGIARDRRTGTYNQQITVKNNGATTLNSPFYLVLDALTPNVTLTNATGTTTVNPPLGSPYVSIPAGTLTSGASVSLTLPFSNPTNVGISFTTRVLSGVANP